MKNKQSTPEHIMNIANGAWASFALATGVEHEIFSHLGDKTMDAPSVGQRAGLSPRGVQALLDALVGTEVLEVSDGLYKNTPEALAFLIKDKPGYLGDFIRMHLSPDFVGTWLQLPQAVKTGQPVAAQTDVVENAFWEDLVRAIAPMNVPVAKKVAADLNMAGAGDCRILDIGGGSGMFSLTLLGANPQAQATQLDWSNVNQIARDYADKLGCGDRFSTIDGDLHKTDFGNEKYDFIIFSHVAHQESPASNGELYKRINKALKPAGTFIINDFVMDNERKGNAFALIFHCNMLLHTTAGATYQEHDYRSWLTASGFSDVRIEPTEGPSSLVYAKK